MSDDSSGKECIVAGVDALIDTALGLTGIGRPPHHVHLRSCTQLKRLTGAEAAELIGKSLQEIQANWDKAPSHSRSEQNWRFKKNTRIGDNNASPEVRCERAIVNVPGELWPESLDWVNQVPVASGLAGPNCDRGRRIDLVQRCGEREYDFIELKIDSDTPLFAAMEILKYGILYAFYRTDDRVAPYRYIPVGENMLAAEKIHLRVVAPPEYYKRFGCDLSWLEESLNEGLLLFGRERKLEFEMDFAFENLWMIPLRSPVKWSSR